VICVGLIVGGTFSLLVLQLLGPTPAGGERRDFAALIARAHRLVIITGAAGAMLFGALLLMEPFRALIRMRWLQVKLGLIVVFVPGMHLLMRSGVAALAEAENAASARSAHAQLLAGTIVTLVGAIMLVVLGRIKPRLGQDYGRTFAKKREPEG
jgi:uncharacterized membrane protein